MSDEAAAEWDGYVLNPDGTIQFAAIVDYGMLAVPSGVIFQFLHAYSQAEMDSGRLRNIQLHLAADKVRECGEALLQMAARLEAGAT
jgi:hypothetical protein